MATAKIRAEFLRKLLQAGATSRVERVLDRLTPQDVAEVLLELGPGEIRTVVDVLFSAKRAARTLRELPTDSLPDILGVIDDDRMALVLGRLAPDDAVAFLHALPDERRERLTASLSVESRGELERLLAYPESTAGSVMTTRFLALSESTRAQDAIDVIRRRSEEEVEQVFYLYVTNGAGRLRGVVPIRKLVSCPPDTPLGELMLPDAVAVDALADQEEVARLVAKYGLLAVPVVDGEQTLLGVITVDDVIEVIHEEATEDMFRMVGLSETERVFSPLRTSIFRRLPWMVVNLATAFLAASVVGFFEASIESVVALAVFLPVVAGMGGNGGTQTLTIITRGLALGELTVDTAFRAVVRETAIGTAVGVIVGMLTAFAAYLWRGQPVLGVVLFLSMILNMMIAGFAGAVVPLLLKRLGQDPALGSGVIVTTFTDVFGFLSFLGIATWLIAYLV